MRTTNGLEYVATQDVPLGGAGRQWEETEALVREKLTKNFSGDATEAIEAVEHLEDAADVREVAALLAG
jgi:hypothetical protein